MRHDASLQIDEPKMKHLPIARPLGVLMTLSLALPGLGSCLAANVEGFAEPYRKIEVTGSTESGLLTAVRVKEGDTVKAGDVLATLEYSVLEASLRIAERRSQMRGRLDAAAAEVALYQERAHKLSLLSREGHASPVELERAHADLAVARAQLTLAQEEVELAQLEVQRIRAQIEQRIFRSPVDGVVSKIVREVGESILQNDPALLTVVQLNPLKVRFPVPVSYARGFSDGHAVTLQIPDLSQSVAATIELVSPVLDAKSGTVEVTCLVNNDSGALRSGMRCLLELTTAK
jgi:RND family efflux transporter MFP subunit